MREEQYIKITSYLKQNKSKEKFIIFLCNFLPLIIVLIYFITTLFLIINNDKNIFLFLAVPASNFLFISIIRKVINKPRPYDVFAYTPIIEHSSGKSFPSRHTSSAFIIAFSYFYIGQVLLGFFAITIAFIIALSRIISGVHFPRDIISAFLISMIWAIIGFNLPTLFI